MLALVEKSVDSLEEDLHPLQGRFAVVERGTVSDVPVADDRARRELLPLQVDVDVADCGSEQVPEMLLLCDPRPHTALNDLQRGVQELQHARRRVALPQGRHAQPGSPSESRCGTPGFLQCLTDTDHARCHTAILPRPSTLCGPDLMLAQSLLLSRARKAELPTTSL